MRAAAHEHRRFHETETLCERCGYSLGSMAPEESCPECGAGVSSSLRARRIGSAYQRKIRFGLAMVWEEAHLAPRASWSSLAVAPERDRWLAVQNTLIAAGVGVLGWLVVSRAHERLMISVWPWPGFSGALMAFLEIIGVPVGLGLMGAQTLYLLTCIERMGVVFFSARRGWRVPTALAWAICAHAASAWWVAALLVAIGVWAAPRVGGWLLSVTPAPWLAYLPPMEWLVPTAAFVLGMLAFESLVYAGVRACRFANAPNIEA